MDKDFKINEMNNNIAQNIVLIGFMGCGKTSVGEQLAKRLSYDFEDTDHLIERKTGDTIKHIFEVHGEEYFRNLETELLSELQVSLTGTVLSTGGGLPIREQNAKLLRKLGQVIYLKASKDTIAARLKGDTTRPLLQGEDSNRKIEKLLSYREPFYEGIAHKVIETDDKTIDEIIEFIVKQSIGME